MRGVDKKIVIVIPSPREKAHQDEIEKEIKRDKNRPELRKEGGQEGPPPMQVIQLLFLHMLTVKSKCNVACR
jgi:hypothetical protein